MQGTRSATPPPDDARRTTWDGPPPDPRLSARIATLLVLTDVVFKCLVGAAVVALLDVSGTDRVRTAGLLAVLMVPSSLAWHLAFLVLLRPIGAWARLGERARDADVLEAATAAYRAPHRFAIAAAASWFAALAPLVPLLESGAFGAVELPLRAAHAMAFASAGLGFGAYGLTSTLMTRLLSAATGALSVEAKKRSIVVAHGALSLQGRVVAMGLCIGLAPACALSAIAYISHGRVLALEAEYRALAGAAPAVSAAPHFGLTLLLTLLPVALFALMSSWLLADDAASGIKRIQSAIRAVGTQKRGESVSKIPVLHDDEVGALADGTNDMIERLEAEARDQARAESALRELNNELERRVSERTALLAAAHDALVQEARDRAHAEAELIQAQKLEAVGRLAAGIAHEINTPIQFVGDSIHFFRESLAAFTGLLAKYGELRELAARGELRDQAAALSRAEEDADLEYLNENLPKALERTVEGLDRVAKIVRSMKEFAHPDRGDKVHADLNRAIESTLTIARNEFKYVAELETDLEPLPPVPCYLGEVNQAVLNIIVNAAHAIAAKVDGTGQRGKLTVRTRADGDSALISIGDTGTGIPEAVRAKVFEQFFTTKEVGRGTGQGLHIARRAIVEQHGGALWFETETGKGTTFFIRLPFNDPRAAETTDSETLSSASSAA